MWPFVLIIAFEYDSSTTLLPSSSYKGSHVLKNAQRAAPAPF